MGTLSVGAKDAGKGGHFFVFAFPMSLAQNQNRSSLSITNLSERAWAQGSTYTALMKY